MHCFVFYQSQLFHIAAKSMRLSSVKDFFCIIYVHQLQSMLTDCFLISSFLQVLRHHAWITTPFTPSQVLLNVGSGSFLSHLWPMTSTRTFCKQLVRMFLSWCLVCITAACLTWMMCSPSNLITEDTGNVELFRLNICALSYLTVTVLRSAGQKISIGKQPIKWIYWTICSFEFFARTWVQ